MDAVTKGQSGPSKSALEYAARQHRMLIDGEWIGKDETIDVLDPATGKSIGAIPRGNKGDVDRAVAAARRAFDDGRWRSMVPAERAKVIHRFADLIEENAQDFADVEVLDNGMPMVFAQWEIGAAVSWLRHFAGMTAQIYGRNASDPMSGGGTEMHAYTIREPLGVAALIVPWNAPVGNLAIKLAPALASGCSIVCKPAEDTSINTFRLGELAMEAGIPAGVFNVVTGYGPEVGQPLVDHLDVDKISFTGSTETGKLISERASRTLKRVTLELGGKSPVLVFDDCDLEKTIPQVAMAIFANSGQVCFAGSRLFVQRKIYDKVVEGVADFAKGLQTGSGFDPNVMIGPLVNAKQQQRVQDYIAGGKSAGAEIVTGGGSPGEGGFFIEPTIFANVNQDMKIVQEEIFGPVLVATPFDDPDEVMVEANNTRYGLGSGIFSSNVSTVHKIARRLQAGNVWVNCYGLTHPSMPFGGKKESGIGRELSPEGLDAYLESKSVFVALD